MSKYFLSYTYDVIKFNLFLFNLLIKSWHVFTRLLMIFGLYGRLLKTMRFVSVCLVILSHFFPKVFHSYFSRRKFS